MIVSHVNAKKIKKKNFVTLTKKFEYHERILFHKLVIDILIFFSLLYDTIKSEVFYLSDIYRKLLFSLCFRDNNKSLW